MSSLINQFRKKRHEKIQGFNSPDLNFILSCARHSDLIVSMLNSGLRGLGLSTGWGVVTVLHSWSINDTGQ